jgi:hypothetical protein
MKKEDVEGEYIGKNWANGEVLHLIAPQGEMKLEFAKNVKKQDTFQLIEALENFKNGCMGQIAHPNVVYIP